MNLRDVVLVAALAAGVGWRLMEAPGERTSVPSRPSIPVTSLPTRTPPPASRVAMFSPRIEPPRPASLGIDCTRGVACPIIYMPKIER